MKISHFKTFFCCLFAATMVFAACTNDDENVNKEEPVVPTPDPEPEKELPEISGFAYIIGCGANSVTGQDVDYSIPLHIELSPTLAGKTLTTKDVTIYIDGKAVATKPWAKEVSFIESMKNYSVGEHTLSVSSALSCEGYKDTTYVFDETFSFYVFSEAPKHRVMLHLETDSHLYGEIITDPRTGAEIDGTFILPGSDCSSDVNDSIVWSCGGGVKHGGTITDPRTGGEIDVTRNYPDMEDIINFHASLLFDEKATNFDAEIESVAIRWGAKDSEPSMDYSIPYKDMNNIDYIHVVYKIKGKKDGKEFSDNIYYEKTFYLSKSDLEF